MSFDCGFTRETKWFRYRAAAIIVEDGCVLLAGNDRDEYFYSVGGGVHVGETAEAAVVREVWEETGVSYAVDRLAVIHENFFSGTGIIDKLDCHEISFYFLMKPRGNRKVNCQSTTADGVAEHMHWILISDLDKYHAYPVWLKEYLQSPAQGIAHIVTRE